MTAEGRLSAQGDAMIDRGESPLPRLRNDLKLLPAAPETTGEPAWSIYDPARNRYFRIGAESFEYLVRWNTGTTTKLLNGVHEETVYQPSNESLAALLKFLHANALLDRDDPDTPASLERIAAASSAPLWKRAIHKYLFFRIPLVRPTSFLRATQPIANFLAGRSVQVLVWLLGLLGVFLVSRQWDVFLATVISFMNWQGAVALSLTMIVTKVLHELGHAYTMTRYGGRVPTMGVAFLVMYPVLYTDTSDAWRLTSRRARLAIGLAGIRVELALALLATFLWPFLPDGPLRAAVFLVASATWISTLAINLSPILRFDGYYILSDWINIPNLQPRAFAIARWWLREWLFGLGEPPPERFSRRMRVFLVGYSLATWLYRLILFIGIALLVYHLFFKLAGLVLFTIEIAWFILIPVLRELQVWFKMRKSFRLNLNVAVTLSVLIIGLWLFAVPWRADVSAPVIVQATSDTPILTGEPGRLVSLNSADGNRVRKDTVLAQLASPDLSTQRSLNQARFRAASIQLKQARLSDADRGDVDRLENELRLIRSAQDRAEARFSRLTARAPDDGTLRDVPAELRPGLWLAAGEPIGRVVSSTCQATAYLDQTDLARVALNARVRIISADPAKSPLMGRVSSIDVQGAESLSAAQLASLHGGEIAAVRNPDTGAYEPLVAVYRVDLALDEPLTVSRPFRGRAFIEAEPESLATRLWRSVASVFIRESGL